ncbi:sec1 family domain-containing protein 2-like isoform X1 [Daphnia carinata]|uniref:sec1 family domain-containing protein 2-like isoform X1 n=2 Tax=Daphnia carinata TaxID=120202 RepID=UPI00257C3BB7|nr:sec1 family domain-containing protein 2-like isoform X1 [Daphnia carinata]
MLRWQEFGQAWWAEARKKMKNAAVFLDPLACECLHWNGGAPSILEAGATCIKELSAFEVVPKNIKKGVFISSTAWHGTNYTILETLIQNSNLEYCVIITSAHLSVHHLFLWGSREGNESEVLQKIEEDVLEWMGNLNYTVEVFSYPLSTLHPTSETILIPSARLAEPFLTSDLGYLNEQLLLFSKQVDAPTVRSINELTYANLPLESQVQVRQLVNNLNQLIQHINGKEDIFTVGPFSRILGTELDALTAAKTRRKTATNKLSVILVDRLLDLASATKCSSENLYDRLLHTLGRLHEYSSDVAVNMTTEPQGDLTTAPGCLAPQMDWNDGLEMMDHLFHDTQEQATEWFTAMLNDSLEDTNDFDKLSDLISHCNKNWDYIERFTHLYQIGYALWRTQKSHKAAQMNILEGIRKSLIEAFDGESPSPLIQVLQLLKTRKDSNLSLDDILVLLVHVYSLAGEKRENLFPLDLEDRLKSIVAEIFVNECDSLSNTLQDFVGVPVDEVRAHRAAQKIVEQLHSISGYRSHMKRYKNLYQRKNSAMPVVCTSFLQQLVEDLFDPSLGDNPDLEHKSGGLKDLLKTGFSLFVNVRKPKPVDNPIVILYVCGGIRPDEVKLIRDLFRQKSPSHKVLIVSSHFISAHDTIHHIVKKTVSN